MKKISFRGFCQAGPPRWFTAIKNKIDGSVVLFKVKENWDGALDDPFNISQLNYIPDKDHDFMFFSAGIQHPTMSISCTSPLILSLARQFLLFPHAGVFSTVHPDDVQNLKSQVESYRTGESNSIAALSRFKVGEDYQWFWIICMIQNDRRLTILFNHQSKLQDFNFLSTQYSIFSSVMSSFPIFHWIFEDSYAVSKKFVSIPNYPTPITFNWNTFDEIPPHEDLDKLKSKIRISLKSKKSIQLLIPNFLQNERLILLRGAFNTEANHLEGFGIDITDYQNDIFTHSQAFSDVIPDLYKS